MTWVQSCAGRFTRECPCGRSNAESYRDTETGDVVHLCDKHAPQSFDEGLEVIEEHPPEVVEVGQ